MTNRTPHPECQIRTDHDEHMGTVLTGPHAGANVDCPGRGPATTAAPTPLSIHLTGTCSNCGDQVTRTTEAGVIVPSFPWYHADTGAEACGATTNLSTHQ